VTYNTKLSLNRGIFEALAGSVTIFCFSKLHTATICFASPRSNELSNLPSMPYTYNLPTVTLFTAFLMTLNGCAAPPFLLQRLTSRSSEQLIYARVYGRWHLLLPSSTTSVIFAVFHLRGTLTDRIFVIIIT